MAGIRDLEEILRRVTDIQGDGFGGLERGDDFIDVEQAKADLLVWHREECLKIIGEDEKSERGDILLTDNEEGTRNFLRMRQRRKLRASLEEK